MTKELLIQVRKMKNQLQGARYSDDLPKKIITLANESYIALDKLEDELIFMELTE